MSKTTTQVQTIIGAIFIFLGAAITLLTLYPLFSFSNDFGYWLLVLLFCSGVLMLIGGISTFQKAKEQMKFEEKMVAQTLVGKSVENEVTITPGNVSWTIERELWQRFAKQEKRNRSIENVGVFIGIAVFGTFLIMWKRQSTPGIALIIAVVIAFIVVFIKARLTRNYLDVKGKEITAHFNAYGVILNYNYYPFWNEVKWLDNVEAKTEDGISFMEFTLKWQTRGGIAHDEMRIPYDPDKVSSSVIQERCHYYLKLIAERSNKNIIV